MELLFLVPVSTILANGDIDILPIFFRLVVKCVVATIILHDLDLLQMILPCKIQIESTVNICINCLEPLTNIQIKHLQHETRFENVIEKIVGHLPVILDVSASHKHIETN